MSSELALSRLLGGTNERDRGFAVICCVLILVQFVLVSYTFPLSELFTKKPLFYIDGPVHWYRIAIVRDFAAHGVLNGYDPYFSAGRDAGIVSNPSAKLPALVATLLPRAVSTAVIWKMYSFVLAVASVVCIPFALRALGAGTVAFVIGGLLGQGLWWASMFRWFHTAGLVSFVFVAYLSVAYVAMVVEFCVSDRGFLKAAGIGILGGIGLLIHPLFFLPVVIGVISALLLNVAAWRIGTVVRIAVVAPLVALCINMFWVYPLFIAPWTGGAVPEANTGVSVTHQAMVMPAMIGYELLGVWRGDYHGSKMYVLLFMGAVYFVLYLRKSERWRNELAFVTAGVVLIVYAAVGATSDTLAHLTQPNRFAPVGYLFLCVPCTSALVDIYCRARTGSWRREVGRVLIWGVGFLVLIGINTNEVRREISYRMIGHYGVTPPEVKGVGKLSRAVIRFLKEDTSPDGRILFETSNARIYDQGHMAGYYAYSTGREFIGGPYPFSSYANMWDGYLFKKPIENYSATDLMRKFSLYNIGWVIVHSVASKEVMDRLPDVELIERYGPLSFYRVRRKLSYFLEGTGTVASRRIGSVVLNRLTGDKVVLKYHYTDGIETAPRTVVKPVFWGDDPTPFIEIVDPPTTLTLTEGNG